LTIDELYDIFNSSIKQEDRQMKKVISILQEYVTILPKESYKKIPVFKLIGYHKGPQYVQQHSVDKAPAGEVDFNPKLHVVVGSYWYEKDEFTGVVKQVWKFGK
jgi:hypothetical protein